jgi:tRNA C32,U32 (ribose-2'-O)-methylase TrmJ
MSESRLSRVAVVLYEPQDPVNIAATVRAMKNMGASTLRLVRPCAYDPVRLEGIAHDTWDVIDRIVHYDDFDSAVADCVRLLGFTARRRAAKWEILEPRAAAHDALDHVEEGWVGLVFGREDNGLPNEILDRIHAAVTIPDHHARVAEPRAGGADRALRAASRRGRCDAHPPRPAKGSAPSHHADFERFFAEAHQALEAIQFFKTRLPEHIMRSIRTLTFRAAPDARELSLLRATALEVVRFLERTGRVERTRSEDVAPRPPRHLVPRRQRGTGSDDAED